LPLVYYAFDLLHLDGRDTGGLPLVERKALRAARGSPTGTTVQRSSDRRRRVDPQARRSTGLRGRGLQDRRAPYAPGNRGLWRKAKWLNRQEFVVVGWTDPEGSRPHLGALLLGYYADDGKLIYAGRVGTGMTDKVLKDLRRQLDPLARAKSPLSAPPPRTTRFGSPLVLSRVHWVEPKLVAEITYLTWTADGLLRQTVYVGLREDKPAAEVRRDTPKART
jgi:ATP-dependent DNA ligase